MPTTGGGFDFLSKEWVRDHRRTPCRSILYVGHRADTSPWWWQTFAPACGIERLAVVDILEGNARSAEQITKEIYIADVRDVIRVPQFDLVMWDEGPEHMAKDEALQMIQTLDRIHGQVVISCPWGYQPQGSGPEDVEFHHWGPMPEDFQAIGMQTRTYGTMFTGGSGHGNLIAWT